MQNIKDNQNNKMKRSSDQINLVNYVLINQEIVPMPDEVLETSELIAPKATYSAVDYNIVMTFPSEMTINVKSQQILSQCLKLVNKRKEMDEFKLSLEKGEKTRLFTIYDKLSFKDARKLLKLVINHGHMIIDQISAYSCLIYHVIKEETKIKIPFSINMVYDPNRPSTSFETVLPEVICGSVRNLSDFDRRTYISLEQISNSEQNLKDLTLRIVKIISESFNVLNFLKFASEEQFIKLIFKTFCSLIINNMDGDNTEVKSDKNEVTKELKLPSQEDFTTNNEDDVSGGENNLY